MHIGKKIRIARAIKGMTQEDLAQKIGKTRPLISQIESSGKVKMSTLRLISKVLDLDPDDPDLVSLMEDSEIYVRKGKSKDIEMLQREVEALRQLVEAQKELIDSLKKQVKKKH